MREPCHPWSLFFSIKGFTGATAELFLERFGEELLQSYATAGGQDLGLPEGAIGKFDGRFHYSILPYLRVAGQSIVQAPSLTHDGLLDLVHSCRMGRGYLTYKMPIGVWVLWEE